MLRIARLDQASRLRPRKPTTKKKEPEFEKVMVSSLLQPKIGVRPMRGINMKRKVNFPQTICGDKDSELFKTPVLHIYDSEGQESPTSRIEVVADERVQCQHCNRYFNSASHAKHSEACKGVFMTSRNPFLSLK